MTLRPYDPNIGVVTHRLSAVLHSISVAEEEKGNGA